MENMASELRFFQRTQKRLKLPPRLTNLYGCGKMGVISGSYIYGHSSGDRRRKPDRPAED